MGVGVRVRVRVRVRVYRVAVGVGVGVRVGARAATMKKFSGMVLAWHEMAPKDMPGKMKKLFTWLGLGWG